MRKNLLPLVFTVSFVFFGLLATNVEASSGSTTNTKKIQSINLRESKLMNKGELTTICKSYLKTTGAALNSCDDWIYQSAQVFDAMIAACDYAEQSGACRNHRIIVEQTMERTLQACESSGPTIAKVIQKRQSLPISDRPELFEDGLGR